MSTRQRSFFDQTHGGNKPYRPKYPRNRGQNNAPQPNAPPVKANKVPIMPGTQTRTKLKAFQFIEGRPGVAVDEADKENVAQNHESPQKPRETPTKPAQENTLTSASRELPPSTPATRLPLADLIGNPDEKHATRQEVTPEESILWVHAQTPNSSHPVVTPARKRKRARSSSPVSSSQNEQSNFFPENREAFDVQRLQQSLKSPQVDPAADLWNRYTINASANDGTTMTTKSVAFAHLIKDSSPRSSETAGSVSGLRRWASCGVEWPTSTKKRRRIAGPRHDVEQKQESEEKNDSDLPKLSKVGLLLERMKETLYRPQERIQEGPSSSSPLPDRVYVEKEVESPLERSGRANDEAQKNSQRDETTSSGCVPKDNVGNLRRTSSEFGDDDDIDMDMIEALESNFKGGQSQVAQPTAAKVVEKDSMSNVLPPIVPESQAEPLDIPITAKSTLSRPEFEDVDEFDEGDDDDLFAADLEAVASKYDRHGARGVPAAAALFSATVPKPVENAKVADDEFGDDDFDDEALVAAEVATSQAYHGTFPVPASYVEHNRAIQRYLITIIQEGTYTDERGREQVEKVLVVEEAKTAVLKNIILRQSWVDTPCTIGSYVHVHGTFSRTGQCVINNANNILILHPDHLISATVVADSFGCVRRAVLQDRVKSTSEANPAMMYGTILHELFQEAMRANAWDNDSFERYITVILPHAYETIVELGLNLNQVREHLRSKIPEIQGWAAMFVGKGPSGGGSVQGRNGQQITLSIDKLLDVEEHIWSPNYGLKGNIDATVQATINDGSGHRQLTVPFELKTGKRPSEHHVAQTALYTLLVSDRYDIDVTEGILYYTENSNTSRVQAIRHELIHLIMKRNELACFVRERLKLPPMLPENQQRPCNNCYARTTCFLYHKLAEDGTSAKMAKKDKFEELVRWLKPRDEAFFQNWDQLLTKEESEMKKFTRELWTMLSTEREKFGRCFSRLTIDPSSAKEIKGATKINRFQYSFLKQTATSGFSFTESQLTLGEPIVVSDEKGHFALANGYVTAVTKRRITVAVDRRLNNSRTRRAGFHPQANQDFTGTMAPYSALTNATPTQPDEPETILYRLDKDEFANGMATARNNILQIMDDNVFKAQALRSLIIQGRSPSFRRVSSSEDVHTQSWETEMNSDQKAAVEKVMAAEDYALVLGMPGTGKTTTIAHIIRALVAKGKSVLLTSYTHTAVDNILLKIRHAGFDVLRLGVLGKIHPEVQDFAVLGAQAKDSIEELEAAWYKPPVVATTCLAINHPLFSKRTFDYCIVDEASQITLPVCLGPVRMAKTFILVGDHFQLPPLVQNKEAAEGGLDVSLFRSLSENHSEAVVTLEHQYRMCADIMLLSNRLIYDGRLKCGNEAVATRSLSIPDPEALKRHHYPGTSSQPAMSTPRSCRGASSPNCHLTHALNAGNKVLFFNTDTLLPFSSETASGNRITNACEALLTTQLVHAFLSAGISPSEIGVITFYRSQLASLRQHLRSAPGIEFHTADKFQGRDKEVVVVSFVRSNADGIVGELLKDWRRINVAVTRARSKLIIVGSKKTLLQGGDVLKGLVEICEEKSWLYDLSVGAAEAHYFPELASQITQGSGVSPLKAIDGSKTPGKSPSQRMRKPLAAIAGGNKRPGMRVPEKKGKVTGKALAGGSSTKVLRDILNGMGVTGLGMGFTM